MGRTTTREILPPSLVVFPERDQETETGTGSVETSRTSDAWDRSVAVASVRPDGPVETPCAMSTSVRTGVWVALVATHLQLVYSSRVDFFRGRSGWGTPVM